MKHGPTARYGMLQSSYWMAFCMVMMFASAYLLDAGLANAQIGMVVAAGGALSAVLQPVVAGMADRSRRVPLRAWIATSAVLLAILACALLLPGLPLGATAAFFGLMILVIQTAQPLINAIGMAAWARGVPVNFGVGRAMGSLAFALLSVVAGRLVATSGTVAIPS